jgi:flagellar biosynthetic protein FliQ
MFVAFTVAAPVLILSMITGLIISVFQATTQIQEPTLSFIPKIIVSAMAILFFGPFMLSMLVDFASRIFHSVPSLVH